MSDCRAGPPPPLPMRKWAEERGQLENEVANRSGLGALAAMLLSVPAFG